MNKFFDFCENFLDSPLESESVSKPRSFFFDVTPRNRKECLKKIPKEFFAFSFALILVWTVLFFIFPSEAGLYVFPLQILPFLFSLFFIFLKNVRKYFREFLYSYTAISFSFLALDYAVFLHAGLIHLAVTFSPIGLFLLVRFFLWNKKCFKNRACLKSLLLASLSWGAYAFTFPPLPLGLLAPVLLAPWFLVLFKSSSRAILFSTFWSGMIYNTINYYWIYNVMKVGPAGMIFLGLVLLIAFFSAYNVLSASIFIQAKKLPKKFQKIFILFFPFAFAGLEMTRTRGDFAFPWSHLGYAFGNHLELLQALSLVGIFGYTLFILYSNLIVAQGILYRKRIAFLFPILLLAVLFLYGNLVLDKKNASPFYEKEGVPAPTISLVQPSIPQTKKWSKEYFNNVTEKTFRMVSDSIQKTDLIILAETAVPDHIRRTPETIAKIKSLAKEKNAPILTGALDYFRIPDSENSPRRYEIYNASFLFFPFEESPKRYIKKHLVPFSERIPFDDVFTILNYVDFGQGNFVPGKETPVYTPFFWTPYICYDAIFGDLVREAIRAGSRMMINITNDGWFGKSTAPGQHLNLIRYRAIEHGYPVARVANSGITAFIDQYGHFLGNTEIFTDRVLTEKLPIRSRETLYTKIGDAIETSLLWLLLAYVLLLIFFRLKFRKENFDSFDSF